MKNLGHLLFIVPFLVFTAFTCETMELEPEVSLEKECFDSRQVKNDVMCAAIYQPVCGCDSKTYGNACEANAKGILKFTEGQCQ
ncbi:Kazal-type serine protease inhibitor family protein [Fontibacter flavus]|uniref:Kazal-type serine protease inhibitor n=1 Tax=Fontibacter flavus TaxID=654838 RepID=A0ABV6FN71_9BACT